MKDIVANYAWLVAMVVTMALGAWRMPAVRDRVFAWVPKLPQRVQWVAPLALAMLAALGEGYLNGVRGEDLLQYSAAQGGQIGVMAIGFWHFWKRVRGSKAAQVASVFAVMLALDGCAAMPWTQTVYDQWREICSKDLAARPDVLQEAAARKLEVGDFAEAICELSDVVAPFVRAQPDATPGDQAVAAARRLGAIR